MSYFDDMICKNDKQLLDMFIESGSFPTGRVSSDVVTAAFNRWLCAYKLDMRQVDAHSLSCRMKKHPALATWRDPPKRLFVYLKHPPVVI